MKKKILLIAPNYFNYHVVIAEALKKNVGDVDLVCINKSGIIYNLIKKVDFFFNRYVYKSLYNLIKKCKSNSYDVLLVISGDIYSHSQWELFFSNIDIPLKIMYQWDSVNNYNYVPNIKFYNKIFTFDRKDSLDLSINYLPLFYVKNQKSIEPSIDLLFVGIWHSDRCDVLSQIERYAKDNKIKYVFKIYYPYYLYLYLKYLKNKHFKYYIYKKITKKQMEELYLKSKCIIDINHPGQVGLTMRTIESIGYGKKIITTNNYVEMEPFYNEDMIQIIDRENIEVSFDFLKKESQYLNVEKYELNNWIKQLFKND